MSRAFDCLETLFMNCALVGSLGALPTVIVVITLGLACPESAAFIPSLWTLHAFLVLANFGIFAQMLVDDSQAERRSARPEQTKVG